jgi:predicted PhzF superfamily epimerase YddE/YHI9
MSDLGGLHYTAQAALANRRIDIVTTKAVQDRAGFDQPRGSSRQLINSFCPGVDYAPASAGSGGNPCVLLCLEGAPAEPVPVCAALTRCLSWPTTHNEALAAAVTCCTATGNRIQCCGHGLLAAAYCWQLRLQCDELPLLMNGSVVPSWREQDNTWLRFQRLPTRMCPVPEWVVEIFPDQQQPVSAATCGDEQGYLVLQWPDDFNLTALSHQLECLSHRSQRALICTAAQPVAGSGVIQLRYFAPQYGVDEDTATGSAMRVLADYWSDRFTHLIARQCSPLGGLLLARYAPGHIDVGGRCIEAVLDVQHD